MALRALAAACKKKKLIKPKIPRQIDVLMCLPVDQETLLLHQV